MKIVIINGPNLNLLGVREPEFYGSTSMTSYVARLQKSYPEVTIHEFQSNIEGEIVSLIQQYGFDSDGIILNAGGYTHTSVAIADAVAAVSTPVIEVHISNIYARETIRQHSLLSKAAKGVISGFGLESYELALLALTGGTKANS